jgi:transcriptional regulator with XRE-family HTH domain
MNIGAKMRAARIQAGLDVNQLAALVGTTAERIEGLETGRNIVNAKILLMVAKHLSVSPVYFFIRDDENEAYPVDSGDPRCSG